MSKYVKNVCLRYSYFSKFCCRTFGDTFKLIQAQKKGRKWSFLLLEIFQSIHENKHTYNNIDLKTISKMPSFSHFQEIWWTVHILIYYLNTHTTIIIDMCKFNWAYLSFFLNKTLQNPSKSFQAKETFLSKNCHF